MGLLDFFKPKGDTVKGLVEGVGSAAVRIRSAITGKADPDTVIQVERELNQLEHEMVMAQAAITKAEAAHSSIFVAGWRPAIGWVAALSLASFYIPQYVMSTWLWVRMCLEQGAFVPYPTSANGILELVLALLGMGLMRTVEKTQGVQGNH